MSSRKTIGEVGSGEEHPHPHRQPFYPSPVAYKEVY